MKRGTKILLAEIGFTVIVVSMLGRRSVRRPRVKRVSMPDKGSVAGYQYETHHVRGAGAGAPVVVLFHGLGGTQAGTSALLTSFLSSPAHVIVPRGKNRFGSNPAWWLTRAADADQDTLAEQMAWTVGDFAPFLETVKKAYGRKPIAVGHSQGAMMASALALQKPTRVKRAIAASAWVPEALWSTNGAPLTIVHGQDDATIPFDRTAQWVQSERERGAPITLRGVPGGHGLSGALHDAWVNEINEAVES